MQLVTISLVLQLESVNSVSLLAGIICLSFSIINRDLCTSFNSMRKFSVFIHLLFCFYSAHTINNS